MQFFEEFKMLSKDTFKNESNLLEPFINNNHYLRKDNLNISDFLLKSTNNSNSEAEKE